MAHEKAWVDPSLKGRARSVERRQRDDYAQKSKLNQRAIESCHIPKSYPVSLVETGTVRRLESMAIQRAADEADIRQRINRWVEALRAMDLAAVMSLYTPDIVSFDLVPPLRYVGAKEKEKYWANVFAMYQRPLGYEIRDLTLTVGDDVAFGHSLNRASGTLQNGNRTDFWLRWTACFRKIDGKWLIGHDQVSVPVDPESGRALLNLEP